MFETQDFLCLHCKREFIRGRRGGMLDHVNTIDIEEIRQIINACEIIKNDLVVILHPYTLRNLLIDLCKKTIASEIIKKWDQRK